MLVASPRIRPIFLPYYILYKIRKQASGLRLQARAGDPHTPVAVEPGFLEIENGVGILVLAILLETTKAHTRFSPEHMLAHICPL